MTRLLAIGFEAGSLDEVPHTELYNSQCVISIVTASPRNGDRCLKLAQNGYYPSGWYTWSMAAAKTEIWTRFGFKPAVSGTGTAGNEEEFLAFYDAEGTETLRLQYDRRTGAIKAYRGSTVIATSSGALSISTAGSWHLIEVRYKPHNSTGIVEVYLNGTQVINFASGDSTNGLESVLTVGLANNNPNSGGDYTDHYFDDWVINDTAGAVNNGRPNDGAILMLQPTGAGTTTQLTRGGADSGANWSQVDEIPPDDADYVYSATVGQRDLYVLEDLPSGVGTIFSVSVLARAKEEISGVGQIGLTQKSGAVTTEDTAEALESTYRFYADLREVNPETTAAYSVAGVNALEAGVTVR